MEYAELTSNVLFFTRQSELGLKCKFKNNMEYICCASCGLLRKTWKMGLVENRTHGKISRH